MGIRDKAFAVNVRGPYRIDEWDTDIYLRVPSLRESREISDGADDAEKGIRTIIACVCEQDGSRVFTEADRDAIADMSATALSQVAELVGKVIDPGNSHGDRTGSSDSC